MKLMDGSGFVFPGLRGALSDMTLTKLLRDNGLADRATVHGFRTSFQDVVHGNDGHSLGGR